jgi:hypothetical protein
MKIIIALAIIGYTIAGQGFPIAASLCMGNVDSSVSCSACYNYGLGTIGARQLLGGGCTIALVNPVTDCLWYSGVNTATKLLTDCGQCNNKAWMNIGVVTGTTTIACSATSTDTTTNCTTVVPNCDQSYCYTTDNANYVNGCRQCSTLKMGAGTVTLVGYPTCAAGNIADCSIYDALNSAKCWICATSFAVNNDLTGCVAFTTDAACRFLSAGNTFCKECKNNYYFNNTVCTLGYDSTATTTSSTTTSSTTAATTTCTGANLMAVSAFLAALLVFFN